MSRFLALDWDYQQLHVVAADVGRDTVRIERAAFVQETQSPNPAEAEALGKLLRDRLKQAGIAPAPVLACIGRDRVIVKEVRYPAVSAREEPAVVRFQVIKELSSQAEEVVIDYMPLDGGETGSERRALAFIVRCEMLGAYQTLCRAAGLRLHALTPRPFGTIAGLRANSAQAEHGQTFSAAGASRAVLTLAPRWREFCVVNGERLLLARTLGDKPEEEVRRYLAVFNLNSPKQTVRALYVVNGGDAGLRERLHQALNLPVHAFDPFAGLEPPACPAPQVAGFAGAVGLLRAHSAGKLPVNFVAPKKVQAPRAPHTLRVALLAGAAAAVVLAATVYGYTQSAKKERELAAQRLVNVDLDGQLAQLEEDAKRINALQEWTSGDISLLDELYDLTDRFPSTETMRLTLLSVTPLARNEKDKEKHVARINLNGVITDDIRQVDQLLERMDADGHYRVDPKLVGANSDKEMGRFSQQFSTQADVAPRKPALYVRRLPASLETASTAPAPGPPPRPAAAPAAVASQPGPAGDGPQAPPAAVPAPAPQPAMQAAPEGSPFRRPRGQPKMKGPPP